MKSIPIALQAHYDEPATTTCFISRVACKDGPVLGFTSLDADLTYDDGDGPVVYRADNGFRADRMQQTADLAVDNTELHGWVSDTGITEKQIRAGLFDYARVRIYRVNYLDLAAGHEIIATGTAGETTFSNGGWKLEFRSLTQQLKQPISTLYSLTCRAQFGDAKCKKPFVWVPGDVTSVDGTEPARVFASTVDATDGHFRLGVVEWLTGDNAGAQMEVDAQTGGAITLALPMPYAIKPGDEFRIRQDCDKTKEMCREVHNNLLNMRAEPFIPVDGGKSLIPGAQQ